MPRTTRPDYRNKTVLPFQKRTDIFDSTGIRSLIPQHIKMKYQTLRYHLLFLQRMSRMQRMRGYKQEIIFFHPIVFKINTIINAPPFNPCELHLIMPVKGQILIRKGYDTPIPLYGHQHIPMRCFFLIIRNPRILHILPRLSLFIINIYLPPSQSTPFLAPLHNTIHPQNYFPASYTPHYPSRPPIGSSCQGHCLPPDPMSLRLRPPYVGSLPCRLRSAPGL